MLVEIGIAEIAAAGVDTFVAGSAVFGAGKETDPNRYDSVIAALRSELAQKNHVPAYIVFNNVSLDEMAELKPRTMWDFRRISGVGDAKAAKYGEAFIKHIAKWVREHSEEE